MNAQINDKRQEFNKISGRTREAETLTDEELCATLDKDLGMIKFTLRKRPLKPVGQLGGVATKLGEKCPIGGDDSTAAPETIAGPNVDTLQSPASVEFRVTSQAQKRSKIVLEAENSGRPNKEAESKLVAENCVKDCPAVVGDFPPDGKPSTMSLRQQSSVESNESVSMDQSHSSSSSSAMSIKSIVSLKNPPLSLQPKCMPVQGNDAEKSNQIDHVTSATDDGGKKTSTDMGKEEPKDVSCPSGVQAEGTNQQAIERKESSERRRVAVNSAEPWAEKTLTSRRSGHWPSSDDGGSNCSPLATNQKNGSANMTSYVDESALQTAARKESSILQPANSAKEEQQKRNLSSQTQPPIAASRRTINKFPPSSIPKIIAQPSDQAKGDRYSKPPIRALQGQQRLPSERDTNDNSTKMTENTGPKDVIAPIQGSFVSGRRPICWPPQAKQQAAEESSAIKTSSTSSDTGETGAPSADSTVYLKDIEKERVHSSAEAMEVKVGSQSDVEPKLESKTYDQMVQSSMQDNNNNADNLVSEFHPKGSQKAAESTNPAKQETGPPSPVGQPNFATLKSSFEAKLKQQQQESQTGPKRSLPMVHNKPQPPVKPKNLVAATVCKFNKQSEIN